MRVGCWVVESGLQREVLQKRGSRRLFSGESFAVSLGGREGTRAWVLRASPWQRSMSSDVQTAELYDVGTGFGGAERLLLSMIYRACLSIYSGQTAQLPSHADC